MFLAKNTFGGQYKRQPQFSGESPERDVSKIWLIADQRGWAFDRIVKQLVANLPDVNLGIRYLIDWRAGMASNPGESAILFWWGGHKQIADKSRSAVCLYDVFSWTEKDASEIFTQFGAILVANRGIRETLEKIDAVKESGVKILEIQDGVDTKLFFPIDKPAHGRLRVGWAGNKKWNCGRDRSSDFKGVFILEHLEQSLGGVADIIIIDRDVNHLSFDEMPSFYRDLDVVLCCSAGDGTPNPILEGAACGCLPLSTYVGILPELERDGAVVRIVDRTPEAFEREIRRLNYSRRDLEAAREINPKVIKERWDWGVRSQAWHPVFSAVYKKPKETESVADVNRPRRGINILNGSSKPLNRLTVPFEWIIAETRDCPISNSSAIEFYRKVLNRKDTGDPATLPMYESWRQHYRKKMSEGAMRAALIKHHQGILRAVDDGKACDFNFVLPAAVDADGMFRLLDGHHRAPAMIAAGKTEVMLEILYISPEWKRLNDRIMAIYKGEKQLYQPIEHPWFSDWPTIRKPRERIIHDFLKSIGINGGGHIDIGSCTGGLCRSFARRCFNTIGFEINENICSVAEYLTHSVFKLQAPVFYCAPYGFDILKYYPQHFDVSTSISLLHHYLWQDGGSQQFMDCLDALVGSCRVAIIDLTTPGDERLMVHTVPLEPEQFFEWCQKEMDIPHGKVIGLPDGDVERPLIALSRFRRFS